LEKSACFPLQDNSSTGSACGFWQRENQNPQAEACATQAPAA
jgi:hypothetical protein